jgi:uncharacterized protein YggE
MKNLTLSAVVLSTALAATATAQTIQVNKDNRTIAITATDKVIVMADSATVHIGFIAYGPDKDAAYAAGSTLSNAIVKSLTTAGVSNDVIESESQNISPVQDYQIDKLTPAEKAQRKFLITQSWSVRANAADAAKILDLAVKAGANQSGQIDWSLKDENAPQAEAAAKALQRARIVATEMAKGLDAKLGALIYASNETQAEPVRPLMKVFSVANSAMAAPPAPLAINPRRVEKTATVYAVFAIE